MVLEDARGDLEHRDEVLSVHARVLGPEVLVRELAQGVLRCRARLQSRPYGTIHRKAEVFEKELGLDRQLALQTKRHRLDEHLVFLGGRGISYHPLHVASPLSRSSQGTPAASGMSLWDSQRAPTAEIGRSRRPDYGTNILGGRSYRRISTLTGGWGMMRRDIGQKTVRESGIAGPTQFDWL